MEGDKFGEYLVSIARRRLVVLRPRDDTLYEGPTDCFNRPKAISCLATCDLCNRESKLCLGFNRPKAISCLATYLSAGVLA